MSEEAGMTNDDLSIEGVELRSRFEQACLKEGLEQLDFWFICSDDETARYRDDHVQSVFVGFRMGLESSNEGG